MNDRFKLTDLEILQKIDPLQIRLLIKYNLIEKYEIKSSVIPEYLELEVDDRMKEIFPKLDVGSHVLVQL